MYKIIDFFKDTWQQVKRRYTLKQNRAYRGKGALEKGLAVEKRAKHAIFMFIIAIFVAILVILVLDSAIHGVGIGTEFHNWIHSFMKMGIPATDPRKPS